MRSISANFCQYSSENMIFFIEQQESIHVQQMKVKMVQFVYSRQAGNSATAFSCPAVWLDKPVWVPLAAPGWRGDADNLRWRCPCVGLQNRASQHPCFMESHTGARVRGAPSALVLLNMKPPCNEQVSWQECRPLCSQPGAPGPAAVAVLGHSVLLVFIWPQEKGGADDVVPE